MNDEEGELAQEAEVAQDGVPDEVLDKNDLGVECRDCGEDKVPGDNLLAVHLPFGVK